MRGRVSMGRGRRVEGGPLSAPGVDEREAVAETLVFYIQGVAVMLPAIITSTFSPQNKNPSVIAIIHPIPLAATDHEMAKECKRCMRWNATRYLGAEMSREVNASSLEFKCFSNITCAWGPGLCEACLDGLFSGQPMPAWFDK